MTETSVHPSINSYICNHQPHQDIEHFCHPESSFMLLLSQYPHPRSKHCSDFYHHGLVLPVLGLHINYIILRVCALLCLDSWLSIMSGRFTHAIAYSNSLFLSLHSIPVYGHI